MSTNEVIPEEHDEDICSGGVTMCRDCYECSDVAFEPTESAA